MYSCLPNTQVGDGMNILDGKFTKPDDFSVGGLSTFFHIFLLKCEKTRYVPKNYYF